MNSSSCEIEEYVWSFNPWLTVTEERVKKQELHSMNITFIAINPSQKHHSMQEKKISAFYSINCCSVSYYTFAFSISIHDAVLLPDSGSRSYTRVD